MKIEAKQLDSGYWHLRGTGPCNWAQPPWWPCDEATLRERVFPEASEEFIRECLRAGATRPEQQEVEDGH